MYRIKYVDIQSFIKYNNNVVKLINIIKCKSTALPRAPLTALFFATLAVPMAPPPVFTPIAVQLSPQAYPLGQHPPPPVAPQLNQPKAQPP